MIEWISDWAGSIIVAVIIGTIIEMILPSGNSKKYIKMVIGVYISGIGKIKQRYLIYLNHLQL